MGTRIFKANYRSSLEGGSDRRGSGVVIGFGSDDGTRGSRWVDVGVAISFSLWSDGERIWNPRDRERFAKAASELKNIYNLRIGLADFWPSEEEKRREGKEKAGSLFLVLLSVWHRREVATWQRSCNHFSVYPLRLSLLYFDFASQWENLRIWPKNWLQWVAQHPIVALKPQF